MTTLLLTLLLQADPAREVERLRSDSVEERDQAVKALKGLGTAAIPALEKASGDPDREVAEQARVLLAAIRIRETFTPAFRKAAPGLEDRLGRADSEWGKVLAEIRSQVGTRPYDGLGGPDWTPLVAGAAKAARSPEEQLAVCDFCTLTRLRPLPPEVVGLLASPDRHVLTQVLTVLGRSTRTSDAAAILPFLRHAEADVRERAVTALGAIRAPGSGPAVLERLKDGAPVVRKSAASAAGAMGLREAAAEIARLVDDSEANVRSTVPTVLGQLGGKEAASRIVPMLKHADAEVRSNAVKALGVLGAEEEIAGIAALLRDDHESVRREAAQVAGAWGLTAAIPDLLKMLEDKDALASANASSALVTLGAAHTADRLRALFKHEQLQTRQSAALALGGLGCRDAIPELREFLKSAPDEAAGDAAIALATLGDRDSGPAIRGILRPLDTRPDLFLALGMLQDAESKTKLRVMAMTAGDVRMNALNTLAQLGDRGAIPGLRRLVVDADPSARNLGALGLATLDSREDAALFLGLLEDEEGFVRSSALMSLSLLELSASTPAMERLLADPETDVRLDAAKHLCALGSRAGLPLLFERSRMPSELNALRRPEVWNRLRKTRAGASLAGTTAEVLKKVGELASLPVKLPAPEGELEKAWQAKLTWVPDYGSEMTLIDVLQQVAVGPYEFVLESDSIRLLRRKEARALWRAWWEAERK